MKIGVFTVAFGDMSFEKALDYVAKVGAEAIEIGTGNWPGTAHCDVDKLLASDEARRKFLKAVESRGLVISALSCHGNPLHPDRAIAEANHDVYRKTVGLAQKLGVKRVVTFSGCPGDSPNAKYPNWVTCPWPPDFSEMLKWQWEDVVIPYWWEEQRFAAEHGVLICLEMHPGFVVYNPETMLKLRNTCGEAVGCNFDPSHLFWQGIDPVYAIRKLGDAIYHVHAKDCKIDPINTLTNGVLDTKNYTDEVNRSWIFRAVGYGHDYQVWEDMISNLRMVGYDWVLSIEHEDSLMSQNEGFEKALNFLKQVVIKQKPGVAFWV
ncbi:MAG: sugar phosphate isomerase/epimerase [Candidatus Berkelbacteria bacterium]|nr:sugar phosphate isomerase/epimerase [Candidatus Berkelbacteria bacterium]